MPTGTEYEGIFPVWDWTALPGTTSRLGVEGAPLWQDVKHYGKTSFVGGATESGSRALTVSVMDFQSADCGGEDEGISIFAQKAWFFLDSGVVAMTTNISLATQGI